MSDQDEILNYAYVGCITVAALSCISSLIVLYLIKSLSKWNGYLLILTSMTISQFLYDFSYLLFPLSNQGENLLATSILEFLQIFGGVSEFFWSNYLSLIVYKILTNIKSVDFMKNYYYSFVFIFTVSTSMGVYAAIEKSNPDNNDKNSYIIVFWTYFTYRIISILFNFYVYLYCTVRVRQIGLTNKSYNSPVARLVSRLKYYPLVQTISKMGGIWYESTYGAPSSSTKDITFDTKRYIAYYLEAFLLPCTGIGYLVIYLIMQPMAWNKFKSYIFFNSNDKISNNNKSTVSTNIDINTKQQSISSIRSSGYQSNNNNNNNNNNNDNNLSRTNSLNAEDENFYNITPNESLGDKRSQLKSNLLNNLSSFSTHIDDMDEDELTIQIIREYNESNQFDNENIIEFDNNNNNKNSFISLTKV